MGLGRKRLGEILLDYGLLDSEQLEGVLQEQASGHDEPLGRVVVDKGLCSEELVLKALSIQLGLPSVQLTDVDVPADVLRYVPSALAVEFQVLPLCVIRDHGTHTLVLAMARPLDGDALDAVRFVSKLRVLPLIASDHQMRAAIARLYFADMELDSLELSLPDSLAPDDEELLLFAEDDDAPTLEREIIDMVAPSLEVQISPDELLQELDLLD